jgi:hypothetical protein
MINFNHMFNNKLIMWLDLIIWLRKFNTVLVLTTSWTTDPSRICGKRRIQYKWTNKNKAKRNHYHTHIRLVENVFLFLKQPITMDTSLKKTMIVDIWLSFPTQLFIKHENNFVNNMYLLPFITEITIARSWVPPRVV